MTYSRETAILSTGQATAGQIDAFITARGRTLASDYAPDGNFVAPPTGLGSAIIEETRRYPQTVVNHDLVASQIAIETAGWQSKYARERNNPGGIGAINSAPDQALSFPTPAAGIRAHVAHLLNYAAGRGPWSADDPRTQAIVDAGWLGVAHTISDLNGRWAYPGTTYGQSIADLANQLLATNGGNMAGDDPRFIFTPDTNEFGYPQGTHGRSGQPIELLILHITMGTDSQAWLLGGNGSSTHYLTHQDGSPRAQHVAEADAAWTPGSRAYAERSINIEVEMLHVTDWTDAIMRETARTIAPILARNNIPAVYLGRSNGPGKRGIIGHRDVPNPKSPSDSDYCGPWGGSSCHDDPGAGFDWTTFIGYVAAELASGSQPPPAAGADPVTGKYIASEFQEFYDQRGGIDIFGRPVSGAFMEDNRLTQYFERSVFQRFPENAGTPYEVQLRLLGTEELQRHYPTGAPA